MPRQRPGDLVVDADGNIFLLETAICVVARVDAHSSEMSVVAGRSWRLGFSGDGGLATKAKLNGPSGLAIDTDGNLYVADYRNKRVRRVDARTHVITTIAGNGLPRTAHAEG